MPDTPVDTSGAGPYPSDMEARVAVLEQIAGKMDRRMDRLEHRIDALSTEVRSATDRLAAEHHADFRWLTGVMLAGFGTMIGMTAGLLGVVAHGFHWL